MTAFENQTDLSKHRVNNDLIDKYQSKYHHSTSWVKAA